MELSVDKIKLERKLYKLANRSTLTDHTNSKIGNLHRFLDDLEERIPSPLTTKDKENCSFLTNSISQQSLLPEEVILPLPLWFLPTKLPYPSPPLFFFFSFICFSLLFFLVFFVLYTSFFNCFPFFLFRNFFLLIFEYFKF